MILDVVTVMDPKDTETVLRADGKTPILAYMGHVYLGTLPSSSISVHACLSILHAASLTLAFLFLLLANDIWG